MRPLYLDYETKSTHSEFGILDTPQAWLNVSCGEFLFGFVVAFVVGWLVPLVVIVVLGGLLFLGLLRNVKKR